MAKRCWDAAISWLDFFDFWGQSSPWLFGRIMAFIPKRSIAKVSKPGSSTASQMLHLWDIYPQNWAILEVNVGRYSSTMEHLGMGTICIVGFLQSQGQFYSRHRVVIYLCRSLEFSTSVSPHIPHGQQLCRSIFLDLGPSMCGKFSTLHHYLPQPFMKVKNTSTLELSLLVAAT